MHKQQLTRLESYIGDFDLPATGAWPPTRHYLDEAVANAIAAAVLSQRPLLVRGEPGVGKSQLARAAAHALGRRFIATVIQPDTEYQELLWSVDHTQRLAEAQLAGHTGDASRVGDVRHFISPGALWWALDWEDAQHQATECSISFFPSDDADAPDPCEHGVVLLIDEIDKADISLANGLLEVLGNRAFAIAPLERKTVSARPRLPLVVLTSNDTRELPPALIRRCVVLDLELPDDLHAHLVKMGATHHPGADKKVLELAAEQIIGDRNKCHEPPRTGMAEYLDLLDALHAAAQDAKSQREWLKRIGAYFEKSHAVAR